MTYNKYQKTKFNNWKHSVRQRLADVGLYIFSKGVYEYLPYEKVLLFGRVTKDLYNPFYSLIDEDGKRLDSNNEMASQVLLELMVNELFAFYSNHKHRPTHRRI